MKPEDKAFFFEELKRMHPKAIIELNYTTPFQLLAAVILSAQATDKQVNKVTDTLFQTVKHPRDVIKMGHEKFTESIQSIGLHKGKSRNIFHTSKLLLEPHHIADRKLKATLPKAHDIFEEYGYYIPDTVKGLEALHGVGEKTAKVVARALYEIPVVGVDTHVHRVCNRVGLVKTKTPLQTSKVIENKIGKEYIMSAHHTIILFGRYFCTARNPKCAECPFTKFCHYYKDVYLPSQKITSFGA